MSDEPAVQPRTSPLRASVKRSAAGLALVTIATRAVGGVKEIVVASSFGRSASYDAFVIASAVPAFVAGLAAAAITGGLVPALVSRRAHATEVLGRYTTITLAALVVASFALFFGADALAPWLASGLDPRHRAEAARLLAVFAPTVVAAGFGSCAVAAFHARGRFVAPASVQLTTPVIVVLALTLTADTSVRALALATVGGALLEMAILVGLSPVPRALLHQGSTDRRAAAGALGRSLHLVVGAFLMGSTLVVDQVMAARLEPGSVSALSYGSRVVVALMAIAATAVGTVLLPHFSTLTPAEIGRSTARAQRAVLWWSIPTAIALAVLARPIIAAVFQRGVFDAADVSVVADVHRLLAFQVPAYLYCIIASRTLAAARRTRPMLWISALNLATNIVLNFVLGEILGVAGIALSTTLVYLQSAVLLHFASRQAALAVPS